MERYVAHETTTPVERRAYVRRSGIGKLERRDVCVGPNDGWEEDIRGGRRTRRARRGPALRHLWSTSRTPVWETT